MKTHFLQTTLSLSGLLIFCILAAGSTDSGSSRSSSEPDSISNTFTVATQPPEPSNQSSGRDRDNAEKVYNNRRDRSVWQVEDYVESKALNPKSIEWIEWGNVNKVSGQAYTYTVQCRHSEVDDLNRQVTLNQIYYLDAQGVVINFINL